jgi:hypothetical protein
VTAEAAGDLHARMIRVLVDDEMTIGRVRVETDLEREQRPVGAGNECR